MQKLMAQVPTIVQTYMRWMTGDMRSTSRPTPST